MKKILITMIIALCAVFVNAQTDDTSTCNEIMLMRTLNGKYKAFKVSDIEYIDFIDSVYTIKPVNINYHIQPTQERVEEAAEGLKNELAMTKTAYFCIRGGRNGEVPGPHAYQYQFSLGPDLYAQYHVVPHRDFIFGTGDFTSTYDLSLGYNGSALGAYTMAKNAVMPFLHHPLSDYVPEMKAINLLFYCIAAQEQADLAGPFTYVEDKANMENPATYNNLKTIYYGIVDNIDTIVACLKNFENREQWYKDQILGRNFLRKYNAASLLVNGSDYMQVYIRTANSLKLRMAMHIVKVDPETAKKWAEEAVASGVIEAFEHQSGFSWHIVGGHPLAQIFEWKDVALSASFESILMSLNHPYKDYLFKKNAFELVNNATQEVTPANDRICGIRSGVMVGKGQGASNPYTGYSMADKAVLEAAPQYLVKWAEVDFLRAEGALRGWEMGGTAQEFYERGIKNAYLEDPLMGSAYLNYVDEYMAREEPIDYVQIDPLGDANNEEWESVTKIGVKWDDADTQETKLEKIITQKYIALYPLSNEAWTELRRTGYPKLFPVLNPDDGDGSLKPGDIIRRIPWVPTDATAIENVNATGIPALGGPDQQATRLWWDVDAPNF